LIKPRYLGLKNIADLPLFKDLMPEIDSDITPDFDRPTYELVMDLVDEKLKTTRPRMPPARLQQESLMAGSSAVCR